MKHVLVEIEIPEELDTETVLEAVNQALEWDDSIGETLNYEDEEGLGLSISLKFIKERESREYE